MPFLEEQYDVCVVGGGHAGCEAALASARLGLSTILFTISMDSIALMPCNPNIGGSSKGHLVREVDALGGQMGINIDHTFLQSKMLNRSRGPAVHSLRAQADKAEYSRKMRQTLQETEHLTVRQSEVTELMVEEGVVKGVKTLSGAVYHARAVVLCTGTYLKSRCLFGDVVQHTGPNGLQPANFLSDSLKKYNIDLLRFKTGTPARIDKRSIDFSKMTEQKGDERVVPFSFSTNPEDVQIDQVSCWLTYTNHETHQIIHENLHRSPLYSGRIEGTGPRYCPSIEDKVVRFADKDRHQVFIEPEGLSTTEMYIGGMSSSLPEDVQYRMYRTVPGLEYAKIIRNAYAIEYDCIDPRQLKPSLEFKKISGLFSGGQLNGSSGYEEAACQGLVAGINAAHYVMGRDPLILNRSQCYIGVLIDDLVTKENTEPYRMMTSRAEYRLLLRQDNADIRLSEIGYEIGLISKERFDWVVKKKKLIEDEVQRMEQLHVGTTEQVQDLLKRLGSAPLKTAVTFSELIRRPELCYEDLAEIDSERQALSDDVVEQVNISIKYDGYIRRQKKQVEQFKKLEGKRLPENFDYDKVNSLRIEAKQKLNFYQPHSVGQASRIAGVSPADISVLLIYLEQMNREKRGMEYDLISFQHGLEKLNIKLTNKQIQQFLRYYELMMEKNKVMNLTAITDFQEAVTKHFLDSLSLCQILDLSKKMSVLDLGTGAGLPGIPLKIAFPEIKIVLMDSLNKRVVFLQEVIDDLQLKGIVAVHGRAEEMAKRMEYRESFDLCVSRAVAKLSSLSEYCLPFVKKGGCFVSYKSGDVMQELEEASRAIQILGGKKEQAYQFQLPYTDISRSFVKIIKINATPKKFPRKAGTPSKEPL